jgi:hypothetical protein
MKTIKSVYFYEAMKSKSVRHRPYIIEHQYIIQHQNRGSLDLLSLCYALATLSSRPAVPLNICNIFFKHYGIKINFFI